MDAFFDVLVKVVPKSVIVVVAVLLLPFFVAAQLLHVMTFNRRRHLAEFAKLRLERVKLRYEIESLKKVNSLAPIAGDDPAVDFPEEPLEVGWTAPSQAKRDLYRYLSHNEHRVIISLIWLHVYAPFVARIIAVTYTLMMTGGALGASIVVVRLLSKLDWSQRSTYVAPFILGPFALGAYFMAHLCWRNLIHLWRLPRCLPRRP